MNKKRPLGPTPKRFRPIRSKWVSKETKIEIKLPDSFQAKFGTYPYFFKKVKQFIEYINKFLKKLSKFLKPLNKFTKRIRNNKYLKPIFKYLSPFYSDFKKLCINTFYFLFETLTFKELVGITLFIMFFIYTDRNASKSAKYDTTKAPNVLCRVIAFLVYIPVWLQLAAPSFFVVAIKFNPAVGTKAIALKEFAKVLLVQTTLMNRLPREINDFFNGRIAVDLFYYLLLFYGIRYLCKRVTYPPLRLHMFLRYHFIYAAFLTSFGPTLKWMIDGITDVLIYDPTKYVESMDQLNREEVLVFIDWITKINSAWVILCIIFIGRGSWLAARGLSFRSRGFMDILIRSNLGQECLYPGEKWSDYGMDDMQDDLN